MNLLSLYSGIGGKDLAAHWAGINTVAMCDSEPFCRAVLKKNFPNVPIFNSDTDVTAQALRNLGIGDIDIVCGGFPCQGWSLAGQQKGVEDERHRWPEMRRIINDVRPTWVLGENVRGLVSNGGLDLVCTDLEADGYEVRAFVLPTGAAVGAPHKRERVFIVAYIGSQRQTQQRFPECLAAQYTAAWSCDVDRSYVVADPNSKRLAGAEFEREGYSIQQQPSNSDIAREGNQATAVKPRLGGNADGFPYGVDATRWPAARGIYQYEWEAPRLTQDKELRTQRIKALGNSAVPQAVYPFFMAIQHIDALLKEA